MKKLIVGLFAVCAAVAAQAAYVDWQYEGANAKNDTSWGTSTSTAANGYTAYLLTAAAWNGIKDSVSGASDIAAKALDSSTLIYEKTQKSKAYYTTHADGKTVAGIRQVSAESGNYYIIIANDSEYSVVANNVSITAYESAGDAGSGKTAGITLTNKDNVTMIANASQSYGVPEPTSGILMLVGLGALALRRRKA